GRLVPANKQSVAFGIATAGGSVGQFVMAPVGQALIETQGWGPALSTMAWLALTMALAATILRSKAGDEKKSGDEKTTSSDQTLPDQTMGAALREAATNRGYQYLTLGFFVCGFQVAFITIHMPSYIMDLGMDASVGATTLALIGLFNIIGTYTCGVLGGRHSRKYLLSGLYFLRSIVVLVFLVLPKSEISVYIFAATMGLLWLGTVPLTSGLVAQMFGVRFISTLFGIVFLSHQLGSFLGVWLGGYLYDTTGSYDGVWYGSIVLGVLAALIHLPIAERPVARLEATT
ncbi:MAG TPA: MFS transporter, partial [Rhodospirillales bacterium]|nr:MFS transporter [Rhodospirillales bacterium]